jgi:CO/xanthine dehydrogenase Mo-binding subunit
MNDLAEALGQDPLEFRLKNAAVNGDLMGNGDPWPSLGVKECLELAIGGWPCGVGPAASVCRVDEDGTVRIHVGSVDISGVNSSLVLVAAEVLGVPPDQIELLQGDTTTGPIAPPSGGSQITYSVSGAVANAAQAARKKLLELAADEFEASVEDLEIKQGKVQVKGVPDRVMTVAELATKAANKPGGPGPIVGEGGSAVEANAPGFVAHLARVKIDPETGHMQLLQYVSVQDVGFALNPMLVEGQVHGGVVQGLGFGMQEQMVYDENGELLTASFMDYSIPKAPHVPQIETILVHNPSPIGPFGARGIGEPPITAGAAALGNAIKDATGVRVSELPLNSETIWRALHGNGGN